MVICTQTLNALYTLYGVISTLKLYFQPKFQNSFTQIFQNNRLATVKIWVRVIIREYPIEFFHPVELKEKEFRPHSKLRSKFKTYPKTHSIWWMATDFPHHLSQPKMSLDKNTLISQPYFLTFPPKYSLFTTVLFQLPPLPNFQTICKPS